MVRLPVYGVQDKKDSIKMLISNDLVVWRLFYVGDYRCKYDVRKEDDYLKDPLQVISSKIVPSDIWSCITFVIEKSLRLDCHRI